MRRIIYIALLLIMTVVNVFAEGPPPEPGADLSTMCVNDLAGRRYAVKYVKSRYMVIVWWAFWCDTWKKALPEVTDLAARQGELGCTVWTVSIDGRYTAEVKPLAEGNKLNFPVLLDTGTWAKKLDLRRVPTVMVLNEQHQVVWIHETYPGNATIEKVLRGGGKAD